MLVIVQTDWALFIIYNILKKYDKIPPVDIPNIYVKPYYSEQTYPLFFFLESTEQLPRSLN